MSFHKDFVWGAATAAFQVEGAATIEGKGPSIWDRMGRWQGKMEGGATGDTACDHYHRMEEDVGLMAEMGLQAYRFSISWPRVLPAGVGAVNVAGLDFYDRLVDALLAKGIQPWPTLYHWDFPLELFYRGGWLSVDSPRWFEDYTRVVTRRLGDRVKHWMTLNEPQIFVRHGHSMGLHAPGLMLPVEDLVRINHQVLLAHGAAVRVIRQEVQGRSCIGWASASPIVGADEAFIDDAEVVDAARKVYFGIRDMEIPMSSSATWNDPAIRGEYPPEYLKALGHFLPTDWESDLKRIAQPLDFMGKNAYGCVMLFGRDDRGAIVGRPIHQGKPGAPVTFCDWAVSPCALYWSPRFLYERYGLPIVITENGMSAHDWVHLDGSVHDFHRIDFTQRYLRQLKRAATEGIPITGYFHWSLMDNLEWSRGYKQRFGLIHVDFETLKRTPKDSARWYAEVINTNGANI